MSLDWHPLADVDPLPGDPEAVRRSAREADATADLLEEQAAALESLAAADEWDSAAVDVLRLEAGELAAGLRRVVPRYRTVGEALRQWAPALEDCQARGRRALRDAQEAQHRVVAVAALPPLAADAAATPEGLAEAHTRTQRHDAAHDDLERARSVLADAVRDRDAAAERAARAIRSVAQHDGLRDGRWDGVRGALGSVGGAWGAVRGWVHRNAGWFRLASSVLGWIATVAGVLALFCPAFAVVAGVAGALAAIADLALAANGDGSWTAVGFDLIGIVLGRAGGRALDRAAARLRSEANRIEGKAAAGDARNYSRAKVNRAEAAKRAPGATDADRAAAKYVGRTVDADAEAARKAAIDRVLGPTRRRDGLLLDRRGGDIWSHSRNLSRAHAGNVRTAQTVRGVRRTVLRVAALRGAGLALDAWLKAKEFLPAGSQNSRRPSDNLKNVGRRRTTRRPGRLAGHPRRPVSPRPAGPRRGTVYGPFLPAPAKPAHRRGRPRPPGATNSVAETRTRRPR